LKKDFIITVGVMLLLGCGALIGYQRGHCYVDTLNPAQQMTQLNVDTHILVFHKTGCKHCQQVCPLVMRTIRQHPEKHYVVLNTANARVRSYVMQYDIQQVPTFIAVKNGQVVARYTGTDVHRIQPLLMDQANEVQP